MARGGKSNGKGKGGKADSSVQPLLEMARGGKSKGKGKGGKAGKKKIGSKVLICFHLLCHFSTINSNI